MLGPRVNAAERGGSGKYSKAIMLVCFGLSWPMKRAQKLQGSYGGRFNLAILDAYLLGVYCWYCYQICSDHRLGACGVFHQPCMSCRELGVYFRNKKLDAAEAAEKQAACSQGRRGFFLSPIWQQIQGEWRFRGGVRCYTSRMISDDTRIRRRSQGGKNHGRKERPCGPSACA